MTISGSSVYKKIKNQVKEQEKKCKELANSVYACETEITQLGNEREEIFSQLALTYLPELEAKDVKQTLHEVQAEVEKIFKEKQKRRLELENSINTTQEKREKLEEELDVVTDSLNQKAKERNKLRGEIVKELSLSSLYTELDKNAKQAEERLKSNKERVKEIEALAKEKLPAYEKNKLFMYLDKRKFKTESYDKRGLTARLDSWVAELINFSSQKANYDFLKAMPELMAQEVSRRQGELDKVVEKMEKIEKNVSDKYGLTKVIEEGNTIGANRSNLIEQIKELDLKYTQCNEERETLDGTKDSYHLKAIQNLKAYLKGETIQKLKQRVKETPGTKDDRLAGRIEEIDYRVRDLKDKAKEIKLDINKAEKKLGGLKEIEDNFSSNDYESDESYFDDDFNITDLLTGYTLGKYQSHDINSRIEDNQSFEETETYHSSSSYSSSHSSDFGGFSSGGGFGGGGGFSSGGGFGGGGFSSGRGF